MYNFTDENQQLFLTAGVYQVGLPDPWEVGLPDPWELANGQPVNALTSVDSVGRTNLNLMQTIFDINTEPGEYMFHAKLENAAGEVIHQREQQFNVSQPVSIRPELPIKLELNAFLNPWLDEVSFRWNMPIPADEVATLELISLDGSLLAIYDLKTGSQELFLSNMVPSGIYLVRMAIGKQEAKTKLPVIRSFK